MPKLVKISLIIILGLTVFAILQQKSQTPQTTESIHKTRDSVIYHGEKTGKVVALTFDADMTSGMKKALVSGTVLSWYDKDIIRILSNKNIPATFFVTGMWAETYPEVVKKLASDPLFEIENHSFSHPAFSISCYKLVPIPDSKDAAEIEKTQTILKNLTGKTPHYFRFPGGCFDKTDVSIVHNAGLDVVQWDVVSGDAFNKSSISIVARVLEKVKPQSIIIMHMMGGRNAPKTAEALPIIIEKLQKEGYGFAKLSDILN